MKLIGEKGMQRFLMVIAFSAISALLLIALFIISKGLPFIFKYGLKNFLLSSDWQPQTGKFGIFPMIVASLWVTFGAMAIGAPLGIAGAVFLS
jgi:phosphate transport system permease protein